MDIYLCSYRYHSWWKKNAPVCNCWQLWNTANFMRSINHLPTGAGFQNHPQYHYSLGYFVFSIFCGLAPHQKHTYDRITLWITICYGTWMNIVFSFEQSITGWWFQPLLKNISQLGWLFPTYGKMFQTTNQIIIINNLYILIRSITMFNYQWETEVHQPGPPTGRKWSKYTEHLHYIKYHVHHFGMVPYLCRCSFAVQKWLSVFDPLISHEIATTHPASSRVAAKGGAQTPQPAVVAPWNPTLRVYRPCRTLQDKAGQRVIVLAPFAWKHWIVHPHLPVMLGWPKVHDHLGVILGDSHQIWWKVVI